MPRVRSMTATSSGATASCALSEREPQEGERGALTGVLSPILLAVDDLRLVGMQAQPDPAQPGGDPPTQIPGLLLTEAMNHNAIPVPLERDARELPNHPLIERIMQEEVREQR